MYIYIYVKTERQRTDETRDARGTRVQNEDAGGLNENRKHCSIRGGYIISVGRSI